MNKNLEVFREYAHMYDQKVEMIKYKYEHSIRVMKISELIAKNLELSEEDIELAKFIGLTHDIARFEQWTNYKTFNDSNSFDHGLRGTQILFDDKVIDEFDISENYDIIKVAILNHNKFELNEKGLSEREILHSKIIRDADKIDIIYSFSTNRILELNSDDSEISEVVKNSFISKSQVEYGEIITSNDRIVEILSLIYDINFKYSLDYIEKNNYITDLCNNVNKKLLKKYVEDINKYIKERKEELC